MWDNNAVMNKSNHQSKTVPVEIVEVEVGIVNSIKILRTSLEELYGAWDGVLITLQPVLEPHDGCTLEPSEIADVELTSWSPVEHELHQCLRVVDDFHSKIREIQLRIRM